MVFLEKETMCSSLPLVLQLLRKCGEELGMWSKNKGKGDVCSILYTFRGPPL